MEFLREEAIDRVESLETSKEIVVIASESKKGSNPGDSADEVETPEAWPDHKGGAKKETCGKWLNRLKVTGKQRNTSDIRIQS